MATEMQLWSKIADYTDCL